MEQVIFQIERQAETEKLGQLLGELLQPGDVVGLAGDLGAGKTVFAGAAAQGLGLTPRVPVTSPTFTLINEYCGRMPIYHMDLYRLGDASELYDLGVWEYYDGQGACLVEWCDRFSDLWPADALVITLELGQGEQRKIHVKGQGRGARLVEELADRWARLVRASA